jgi:glycosyltransferase involved in cell wall biosynthesis
LEAVLMSGQKHLVISAVNLSEGGPLTVLLESLEAAALHLPENWKITALVHSKSLVTIPRVQTWEYPQSKRSWLKRLWLEWFEFNRLSRTLEPDLWLSLHDITPRVKARRQVVYCHNPSPFYKLSRREARQEPRLALFNKLYRHLYRVFILRNHSVVVQQAWLRDAFQRMYSLSNVIVAYPMQPVGCNSAQVKLTPLRQPSGSLPLVLLYPALPRVFKNIDVLCEAMRLLSPEVRELLELRLTLSGSENAYARDLHRRFSNVSGVKFIGRQTRLQMDIHYQSSDLVLFPSKLETWGLPISEAKSHGKPLLVADLPYAHETVGNYEAVTFLPANDARAWATALEGVVTGNWTFDRHTSVVPDAPFAANWPQLWRLLTNEL